MEEEKKEELIVEETKKENILTRKKEVKGKPLKIWLIVMIAIFMLITFGLGVYFGKEVFNKKEKSNEPVLNEEKSNESIPNEEKSSESTLEEENKEENIDSKGIITDITDLIKEKLEVGNLSIKSDEYGMDKVFINGNLVLICDGHLEIRNIYQVDDNYLITVGGSNINSTEYHLFDKNGTLLQDIYELEDNNMVIATSDRLSSIVVKDNVIELYGTRLDSGPSLMYDINGEKKYLYICDDTEMSNVNIDDSYVVVARYQLIYSNGKFEIKRVAGTEETLGQYKEKC